MRWKNLRESDNLERRRGGIAMGGSTLQKNADQRVQPESFNHGTSDQRMCWFIKGLRLSGIN